MTQALAGFNQHGLVLATDSRATRVHAHQETEFFSVNKLLPLHRFAAILSGGAGISVPLTQALKEEISRRRGLEDPDDIFDFAQPFLTHALSRYLAAHPVSDEGLNRIYFILAGYSPTLPPPGYRLVLLGSDEGEPLHLMPVGNLVVMPRNLGMEMRLFKALTGGAPLAELLAMSREFLEKMAAAKDEVGPPYYFATITPSGYQPVEM